MTVDGTPLEAVADSFHFEASVARESDPLVVVANYVGGGSELIELLPGQRCDQYCELTDCGDIGSLVLERVYFDVSDTSIAFTGAYDCVWTHDSVSAGP